MADADRRAGFARGPGAAADGADRPGAPRSRRRDRAHRRPWRGSGRRPARVGAPAVRAFRARGPARDSDGLKRINDAYGSGAGDRTLVGVATALSETIRNVDTPIRMGGDEFCVLLPQQTASRARALADRLAGTIERVESPTPQPL